MTNIQEVWKNALQFKGNLVVIHGFRCNFDIRNCLLDLVDCPKGPYDITTDCHKLVNLVSRLPLVWRERRLLLLNNKGGKGKGAWNRGWKFVGLIWRDDRHKQDHKVNWLYWRNGQCCKVLFGKGFHQLHYLDFCFLPLYTTTTSMLTERLTFFTWAIPLVKLFSRSRTWAFLYPESLPNCWLVNMLKKKFPLSKRNGLIFSFTLDSNVAEETFSWRTLSRSQHWLIFSLSLKEGEIPSLVHNPQFHGRHWLSRVRSREGQISTVPTTLVILYI